MKKIMFLNKNQDNEKQDSLYHTFFSQRGSHLKLINQEGKLLDSYSGVLSSMCKIDLYLFFLSC